MNRWDGVRFDALQQVCWQVAEEHGFHAGRFSAPEKLALIHSEVSEALEEYRSGKLGIESVEDAEGSLKPVGFVTEMADVVIRCLDLCAQMGLSNSLRSAIQKKIEYNNTRPYRHGRAF